MIRFFSLEEKHLNARNYDPDKWVPPGYEEVDYFEWLQRMRYGPGPRQLRDGKVQIEDWVYQIKISPNSTYVRVLRQPPVKFNTSTPSIHQSQDRTYGSIRADRPYRVSVGTGSGAAGHTTWILDTEKERSRRARMGFVEKVTVKADKEQQ